MEPIQMKNLTKFYKSTVGIQDVSLEVKQGEIFGFIGPNGSGKTTTIKLLLNMIFPTHGEAKIFGLDVVKDSAKIKKKIGYVPGEVRFYEHMTVPELMKTTLSFHDSKNFEQIQALCETFELDQNKKLAEMSLGNKKKVAIALALVHEPQLIILDEPTNGLDPLMQKRLFEVLSQHNKKGATIFVSSHNLTEVQEHCTRAAFIKQGQILKIQDLTVDFKQIKTISVVSDNLDTTLFEQLGAKLVRNDQNGFTFQYEGDLNRILKLLSEFNLQDIRISNLSLEDRFLSYYEGGESK